MPFPRRAVPDPPDPALRARLASALGVPDPDPPGPPGLLPGPPPAPAGSPEPPAALSVPPAAPPDPPAAPSWRAGLAALLPGADPGPTGARALALVAAVAVAVTGLVVWRGRPRPVDVPPPAVAVASATPSAALLVVDVAGDVRHPGLVRLPPGSRVADALAAAGGLRPGATTEGLNLARRLVDGEQVLVGAPAAAAAPAPPGGDAAGTPLDLNAATADQLDALPGIGPVLAERIVEWRTQHGRFATVDQLREVGGIGAKKFDSLKALLTV
jgi:competence protein ComEA